MRKCLVLLSGGMDSTTASYWVKSKGYHVETLFFDFGRSKIDGPRESAKVVAQKLGVCLHIIRTTLWEEVLQLTAKNSVQSSSEHSNLGQIFIFGNVSCLCAMSIAYALMLGINTIVIGIHRGDIERDGGLITILQMMESLAKTSTNENLKILTPFRYKDKSSIVKTGAKLGVPFENTWSCGKDADIHCGKCIDCLQRQSAFTEASMADPTKYKATT